MTDRGTGIVRGNACRSRRGRSRSGVVLLIVMVVVLMISMAGLSFVLNMSTENQAVHLFGDELCIAHATASGAELLKAMSEMPPAARREAGGLVDNPDRFQGVLLLDDDTRRRSARFSLVAPRIVGGEIEGVRFGAVNESTRLNLGVLSSWEKRHAGAAQSALLHLPGMTEPIAAALLDWVDADEAPRPSGAEADYYSGQGLPYGPKNGVPTSLEELLLVRDVSRERLFGLDTDFNHTVEEAELRSVAGEAGGGASNGGLPWASLLTVFSAERNTSDDGTPRVHLNQKDLSKLDRELRDVFDEASWAEFIIAYRQWGPYRQRRGKASRSKGRAGGVKKAKTPKTVRRVKGAKVGDLSRPGRFRIRSVLDLVGAKVRLPREEGARGNEEEVTLLESPFGNDPMAMQEHLFELMDHATTVSGKLIRGRINVNGAPREVLLGVPGLDRLTVDRILSARDAAFSDDDRSRRHATWLLTEGIVDLDLMKRILPYVTAGGDVFRAQVVACFDSSGPSGRAEVVIDATVSPPRQVYWKDLRLFGRGFSLETLGLESSVEATGGDAVRSSAY